MSMSFIKEYLISKLFFMMRGYTIPSGTIYMLGSSSEIQLLIIEEFNKILKNYLTIY